MSAQAEILIIARREMRKNLRSAKGIAMFTLFVLGGLVPSLFRLLIEKLVKDQGIDSTPPEAIREIKMRILTSGYGEATAKYLIECPTMLLGLFKGTLWFFPLVILMVGFDTIAGETQHRTIRYLSPRAGRASITLGKGLGIWAVSSLMLLVLYVTTWILTLVEGGSTFGSVLSWGVRFWLFAAMYGASYVGLTVLMSSLFRTPVVSLFVGFGTIVIMGIARMVLDYVENAQWATWLFPAAYEKWLLSHDPAHSVGGAAVLLAWGAACLIGATEIVRRRDV